MPRWRATWGLATSRPRVCSRVRKIVNRLPAAAASAAAVGVSLLLAGCVDPPPVCTAPAGHAMLVAELFFGRSIAPAYQRELGATVTDTQWAAFERTVLTPAFPDG